MTMISRYLQQLCHPERSEAPAERSRTPPAPLAMPNVEWQFQCTTIDANHPNGYEWCVNAPAIDSNGVVYGKSEDGNFYAIPQGHTGVFPTPQQKMFLKQAIGAAYTPLSIGADGKLYEQNDGHLFVVGN